MSGFIDLQVNGYAGVDFNADDVCDDDIVAVCRRLKNDGCDCILATIITAPMDRMIARIDRLAACIDSIDEVRQMIGGIHIEGPFISPVAGYVGAHPSDCVRQADASAADRLVDAGGGHVKILTLAPEMDDRAKVTDRLTRRGVVVAAGHSDASLDQLRESIDHGLGLFTHLGNGCPSSLARHDNIIQRVLSLSDDLMVSFIADGHHVPDFALANYLRRVPDENVIIVTDAISAAGLGAGKFLLAGQTVTVDDDGAAWAESRDHFAGCATPMNAMVDILVERMGMDQKAVAGWTRSNPARLLRRCDS